MALFVALEIPQNVGLELESLKGGVPGAVWISRENYHLTLAYIGDVDANLAADIDVVLAGIARPAFTMKLEGVGVFGGKRPRALWAGISTQPLLTDLQAEIAWNLTRVGARIDARKFSPHVTLARLRNPELPRVAAYLSENGGYSSQEFDVSRFVLMSSRPSKGGGPYVTEQTYALQGLSHDWDEDENWHDDGFNEAFT